MKFINSLIESFKFIFILLFCFFLLSVLKLGNLGISLAYLFSNIIIISTMFIYFFAKYKKQIPLAIERFHKNAVEKNNN